MFVWIKLNGIDDTTALIQKRALDKKILLIPGSVFEVEDGKLSSYCRASYSFATEEVMDEVFVEKLSFGCELYCMRPSTILVCDKQAT